MVATFGLTISLKKTEVMYQKPTKDTYNLPKINISGHSLNAVDQFTYLGCIISNDLTIFKDLDHRLAKACSFGRLQKCAWQNHSLRLLCTLLCGSESWVLYRSHPPFAVSLCQ